MTVRRYDAGSDFEQIAAWGREYGAKYVSDQFPQTGFIIDGIGAYFLYQTDSTCCWLENMIVKRGLEYHLKDEGIQKLFQACVDEAKAMGFKVAYAASDRYTVALRAKKYGAQVEPNFMMFSLKLNET